MEKRAFILNLRKSQLTFIGHIRRKGVSQNLILIGHIGGKMDRGNQHII